MAFIQEFTYDIKDGEFANFQQWLATNEAELAKHQPEGSTYVGTYACIFGSADRGMVKTVIRLDDYGAMDRSVEALRDGGRYSELMQEAVSFSENGVTARQANELWKEVGDTVYMGD